MRKAGRCVVLPVDVAHQLVHQFVVSSCGQFDCLFECFTSAKPEAKSLEEATANAGTRDALEVVVAANNHHGHAGSNVANNVRVLESFWVWLAHIFSVGA